MLRSANSEPQFKDFSELYRAAFAEQDPERKIVLLQEVQKAIDAREQSYTLISSAAA